MCRSALQCIVEMLRSLLLLNVLCDVTIELSFENFYCRWRAKRAKAMTKLACSPFPIVTHAPDTLCVCVCVCLCVCVYA